MNKMSRDLELEKRIDAYVKGKLDEEQAMELWEDLLERPDYIELLETELGLKSIFEQRANNDNDKRKNTSSAEEESVIYSLQKYWKWMAAAAAIVILIVSVNILQRNTDQSLNNLAVKKFKLAETLSSAKILRSQMSRLSPADSLLNRGFEAALSGDVDKALATYDKIIDGYSDDPAVVKAYLNKGLIQYNGKKYQQSISSFEHVLDKVSDNNPILAEKAYWYLGNAYIHIDQLKEARDAIHNVYIMDGIYRKSANRVLKKLDYKLSNMHSDDGNQ